MQRCSHGRNMHLFSWFSKVRNHAVPEPPRPMRQYGVADAWLRDHASLFPCYLAKYDLVKLIHTGEYLGYVEGQDQIERVLMNAAAFGSGSLRYSIDETIVLFRDEASIQSFVQASQDESVFFHEQYVHATRHYREDEFTNAWVDSTLVGVRCAYARISEDYCYPIIMQALQAGIYKASPYEAHDVNLPCPAIARKPFFFGSYRKPECPFCKEQTIVGHDGTCSNCGAVFTFFSSTTLMHPDEARNHAAHGVQ